MRNTTETMRRTRRKNISIKKNRVIAWSMRTNHKATWRETKRRAERKEATMKRSTSKITILVPSKVSVI